jgi:hypothetical protein
METAIVWPARYLAHVPQLLRTVQVVALSRARDRDIAHAARKLGLPGRLARRWNGEGLSLIAAGLRRDAVAVFLRQADFAPLSALDSAPCWYQWT